MVCEYTASFGPQRWVTVTPPPGLRPVHQVQAEVDGDAVLFLDRGDGAARVEHVERISRDKEETDPTACAQPASNVSGVQLATDGGANRQGLSRPGRQLASAPAGKSLLTTSAA